MNIVIIGNDELINRIRSHYASKVDHSAKVPYSNFVVSSKEFKIIVYNSKKIMFQGKDSFNQANLWDKNLEKTQSQASDFLTTKYCEHIGSDEVGTGDYFGPVVVVASYVNDDIISKIKSFKIMDSKKLSDSYICEIAPTLIEIVPHVSYILSNIKYNECIKTNNLNQIKAKMHNYVLYKLQHQFKRKIPTIIDQFTPPKKYYEYLIGTTNIVDDLIFETKAEDKYLAVAISAIIARYHFINELDELGEQVQTTLLKGAGYQVDNQGASIVLKHGFEILNTIAKQHFKNTQKITSILQMEEKK